MNRRNLLKGLVGIVTAVFVPFRGDTLHGIPIVWDQPERPYRDGEFGIALTNSDEQGKVLVRLGVKNNGYDHI